jgi:hypothetical protein
MQASRITFELTRPRGGGKAELIKQLEKHAIAARVQRFVRQPMHIHFLLKTCSSCDLSILKTVFVSENLFTTKYDLPLSITSSPIKHESIGIYSFFA